MNIFTKKEIETYAKRIFTFIDSGKITWKDETFYGHPGFYFFHTKQELEKEMTKTFDKDHYTCYDLFYKVNCLIRFMLGKYDSHTKVEFLNTLQLPIQFMIEKGEVHVINITPEHQSLLGSKLLAVNGVSVATILEEMEKMIGYSTTPFLNSSEESFLHNVEVLKSLPSMSQQMDTITYTLLSEKGSHNLTFSLNDTFEVCPDYLPPNYSYDIVGDCMVLHYNACQETEKMQAFIETIRLQSEKYKITHYIVDLRYNGGGDSSIVWPLVTCLTARM